MESPTLEPASDCVCEHPLFFIQEEEEEEEEEVTWYTDPFGAVSVTLHVCMLVSEEGAAVMPTGAFSASSASS